MTTRVRTTTAATIALWTAQLAAAGMFAFAGTLKLAGNALMVQEFAIIGLGQWFRYLTGAIEVAGAVALLIPATAAFGAIALAITMVGAVIAHLFVIGGSPAIPIILLAITTTIAWRRRESLQAVLPVSASPQRVAR
jgi:uncharacterized membrane protein YphA (DoxX/SURF4 family)